MCVRRSRKEIKFVCETEGEHEGDGRENGLGFVVAILCVCVV